MTDYEMSSLFFEILSTNGATLGNYLTLVTAMLVASFLVAHHLDGISTALVLVIFTLAAVGLGNELQGTYSDMARLGEVIAARAQAGGTGLGWHPAAQGVPFAAIRWVVAGIAAATYLGTLWFFFRCRRSGGMGFGIPMAAPGHGRP